jgi:hypothetical protein
VGEATNVLKAKDLKNKRGPSPFAVLSCFWGASIKGALHRFQRGQTACPPEAPQALAAGCTPIRPLIFCGEIFGVGEEGLDWIESAKGFDSGISYVEIIRFAQDDSRSVREKTVRRED